MFNLICKVSLAFILWLPFHSLKAETYDFVVAQDGSGDYTSIQNAIDACKAFPDSRVRIYVKNGIYKEKIMIPSCNSHLSIIGESVKETIVTWNDYFDKVNRGRNSTFYTYTFKVEADDFILENMTVENSSGPVGQAIALHLEGDQCVIRNCRLLGFQDTVYATGRSSHMLFVNSYIEGTTDFIFGEATVLFDHCVLHCKSDSYITAASTPAENPFGFVFKNCVLSAAQGVTNVFLGRPWRIYARVAFLNCEMGPFIVPEGWNNWGKPEAEKTTRFSEYMSTGIGISVNQRVNWSYQLSDEEASTYANENILGQWVTKIQ